MSFRTAHHALGRRSPPRNTQTTPYRDPTPEEWAKKMDDYHRQTMLRNRGKK